MHSFLKLCMLQGRPKGISKKGGPSKEIKTTAQSNEASAQPNEANAQLAQLDEANSQPNETLATTSNQRATHVSVCSDEAIRMYCGIKRETLAALLNHQDILNIELLSVDTSPIKPQVPAKLLKRCLMTIVSS